MTVRYRPTIRGVLFDLDGTLVDTAPDLVGALNRVLADEGHPALPVDELRPLVSFGSTLLLQRGFGGNLAEGEFEALRARFLKDYADNICVDSSLFTGMASVLDRLEQMAIPWGIVTNKPTRFTNPLMQQLGLDQRTQCVVSGDTVANAKPHPEPMLHACELINREPGETLYIGDALRDIQAGKAAGMCTLVANFGYIAASDDPQTWQADGMINHPSEILEWLQHD